MGRPRKHPENEIHLGKDGYAYDRKERHKKIIAARGERCELCGYTPPPAAKREHGVTIDHIDGNRANYDPANLRVLCFSCNVKEQDKRLRAADPTWNSPTHFHGQRRFTPQERRERHRAACLAYYYRIRNDPLHRQRLRKNERRHRERTRSRRQAIGAIVNRQSEIGNRFTA